MSNRHNVFISYHHTNDEHYKNEFERLFSNSYDILETKAVSDGDIDPYLKTDTIRARIRDEHIRVATVTVVLIGTETWKRKHVDWGISGSIRNTQYNSRTGLLGILLPTRNDYNTGKFNPNTIPPRLYDNFKCGFASIHNWNTNPSEVQKWIHDAFQRRLTVNPDNSRPSFAQNRTGERWS